MLVPAKVGRSRVFTELLVVLCISSEMSSQRSHSDTRINGILEMWRAWRVRFFEAAAKD